LPVAPSQLSSTLSPVASSQLSSTSFPRHAVAIIVDVVLRRAFTIIVDVVARHAVAIIVDFVTRCAVAIIVDNGKTPAHRQRQRRHRDEGNNAIATTAKSVASSPSSLTVSPVTPSPS
jgi:hypothetical protein